MTSVFAGGELVDITPYLRPNLITTHDKPVKFHLTEIEDSYVIRLIDDGDEVDEEEEVTALASQLSDKLSGLGSDSSHNSGSQPTSTSWIPLASVKEGLDSSEDSFEEFCSELREVGQASSIGLATVSDVPPHTSSLDGSGVCGDAEGHDEFGGGMSGFGDGGGGGGDGGGGGGGGAGGGGGGAVGGGAGGGALGGGAFGPVPLPVLQPHPDNFTRWDKNPGNIQTIQALLNRSLTHRQNRAIIRGGNPAYPQQKPYPLNPYFSRYINKLLLPTTMSSDDFLDIFGMTVDNFFRLRDLFIVPALAAQNKRPYVGTADSVMACFLLKFHKNIDDRFLGFLFGDQEKRNASRWFHLVLDYIYVNSQFLIRSRSLSQVNHLRDLFEELHGSTMRQSRCAEMFRPQVLNYQANNPAAGPMKLVTISWDTRHIKIPKLSDHLNQRRSYSTKIKQNALSKLIGASQEGIVAFIYVLAASISPASNDERLARYILDMETNLGKSYNFPFVRNLVMG